MHVLEFFLYTDMDLSLRADVRVYTLVKVKQSRSTHRFVQTHTSMHTQIYVYEHERRCICMLFTYIFV